MKKNFFIIALVILFIAGTFSSTAQLPGEQGIVNNTVKENNNTMGFFLGSCYNSYNSRLTWEPADYSPLSPYRVYSRGTGWSSTLGYYLEYPLDDFFGFRLSFNYQSYNLSNAGSGYAWYEIDTNKYETYNNYDIDYSQSVNYFSVNPGITMRIFDNFQFKLGTGFMLRFWSSKNKIKLTILDSGAYMMNYMTQQRVKTIEINDEPSFLPGCDLIFALETGISYQL